MAYWEGSHYSFGFSKMQRSHTVQLVGDVPSYPYLNKNEQRYATLCGDTVQYEKTHQLHTTFLFNF